MNDKLRSKIEACNSDFFRETGHEPSNFFCPILHTDENSPLILGHIINTAFGTCNKTVPQRKDVDEFYGDTEADFSEVEDVLSKKNASVFDKKTKYRRAKPSIEFLGKKIRHYPLASNGHVSDKHTPIAVVSHDDKHLGNIVVKKSPESLIALDGKNLELVVDYDYRPAVAASLIKAAHLTCFEVFGYSHVFSTSGIFLASVLRDFFLEHRDVPSAKRQPAVHEYFGKFTTMIHLIDYPQDRESTVKNYRFLACFGSTKQIFALGILVRAKKNTFCVFVPADGESISIYFSFLKTPPPSIAVKEMLYCPESANSVGHWKENGKEPIRLQLATT